MKKIFLIITAALTLAIIALLITTNFIFITETITTKIPESINIYNKSVASLNNKSYKETDAEFDDIMNNLKDIGKVSIFDRLISGIVLDDKIIESKDDEYSSNISDVKKTNICVEVIYETKQDKIVYVDGKTKVINYNRLLFVLPEKAGVNKVVVYYSNTEGYDSYNPLIMNGKTGTMIDYIKTLSK